MEWMNDYDFTCSEKEIVKEITKYRRRISNLNTLENLKLLFSLLDLTSLNTTDSDASITAFCDKINQLQSHYPEIPDPAAICVYPVFVATVKNTLKKKNVNIASVAGGFPSSQTPLEVKIIEISYAVDKGADEIDIVMPVGKFMNEEYEEIYHEITTIKLLNKNIHLKVILETGAIKDLDKIYLASLLALEAGADFIKTSTGKLSPASTPEAAYVMTKAIKAYHDKTGGKKGFKPAGGIATTEDALLYFAIVQHNLGKEWITPDLFRIGASRLANRLIEEIVDKLYNINYF